MTIRLDLVAEAVGPLDVGLNAPVGLRVSSDARAGGVRDCPEAAVIAVGLPRSKRYAQALIEEAARKASDWVVVDGQKTDGIDSLYKACRARVPVETLTKAHGRAFWFRPTEAFAEWRDPGPMPEPEGFFTQPGVFSEGKVDPASALLADALPPLKGDVADLGGGWGYLSRAALDRGARHVHLVETEGRALDCARLALTENVTFHWADALTWDGGGVDTVVMNPPFHQGRAADTDLGRGFIAAAARALAPRGALWMVANRHLPYEAALSERFAKVEERSGSPAFKLFHATRPLR